MKNETKEGVLVIYVEGNLLGEHTNSTVMELINNSVTAGNKKVLFNLGEMKFINSTGLGMLLSSIGKVRTHGGELALCAVPDQMKKLLQMTKLESIFKTYADEPTAIAALKA